MINSTDTELDCRQLPNKKEKYKILYPLLIVPLTFSLLTMLVDSTEGIRALEGPFTAIPMTILVIVSAVLKFDVNEQIAEHLVFVIAIGSYFYAYMILKGSKVSLRLSYAYSIIQGLLNLLVVVGKGC